MHLGEHVTSACMAPAGEPPGFTAKVNPLSPDLPIQVAAIEAGFSKPSVHAQVLCRERSENALRDVRKSVQITPAQLR